MNKDNIRKIIKDFELYFSASAQRTFVEIPMDTAIFEDPSNPPRLPPKGETKELGLWWYPIDGLAEIYSSITFKNKIKSWMIEDIAEGFLYYYYVLIYNTSFREALVTAYLKSYEIDKPYSSDELEGIENDFDNLKYIASKKQWSDEIEGYGAIETDQLGDLDYQICEDNLMFSKPQFKLNLIQRYCKNWVYNEAKSSASIMVFNKKSKVLDPLVWHVIIRSPKKFGNDTFEVVLAHDNNKKINPKQVVFQLFFPDPTFTQFTAGQLFNAWKTEVAFRYKYVERYIDYIEPLIAERMQGVE